MHTRVAILGGGLSGLALAHHLHKAGADYHVFEARDRFGGRILSRSHRGTGFDLGPSWYWPGQPRMAALVDELGLSAFEQHTFGAQMFEMPDGRVIRDMGFAAMDGALRVNGGMNAIVDALLQRLPSNRLHAARAVQAVSRSGAVTFENGDTATADTIVVAMPPRVAAKLTYAPKLAPSKHAVLNDIPTWMGGQAKVVAVYDRPFWREAGLSGDAISRRGPLVEIHDASGPKASDPAALFGFVGLPVGARQDIGPTICSAAVDQLVRIFGASARTPVEVFLQDWAFDTRTATELDHVALTAHPNYGMPNGLNSVWGGRLRFCATEFSPEMGGYLEGALSIADRTAKALLTPDAA